MLEQLLTESDEVGLSMNNVKTKVIFKTAKVPILINGTITEYLEEYRKHNIGQCTLTELTDEDLIQLGVDDAEIRQKIINEVKNLPIYEEIRERDAPRRKRRPRAGRADCLFHSDSGRGPVTCCRSPAEVRAAFAHAHNKRNTESLETMKCYICLVLFCFASVETDDTVTEVYLMVPTFKNAEGDYCARFCSEAADLNACVILIAVEAVAGYSAELPCNITADDPDDRLTVLLWYRNGTDTAIYG
ncbi:hypothetical protein EVAR_5477_1 [Eumeta japonica]|uniref:SAM domain-containing protein n=1 Tax=Eumeta variegata TaxID=151549 RepID=A0A4C1T8Z5_EUMVA|nr:hypothetical protein EVAR_5477_1 [Eumeta japonica]